MDNNLNYPYLLAVHTLCVDGQLHQNELQFLQSLARTIGIDPATEAAAELILAQANNHLSLKSVLWQITPDQRPRALSLSALAAQFDGALDRTEQKLLEQLRLQWKISDDLFAQMQDLARKESQRLIAELKTTSRGEVSTGAKVLSGLEAVLAGC